MGTEAPATMHCNRCHHPTRYLVSTPKRRRPDGTAICFWQICLKCVKELENGRKHKVRSMPVMSGIKDVTSGLGAEPNVLRRVPTFLCRIRKGKKLSARRR